MAAHIITLSENLRETVIEILILNIGALVKSK